MKPLAASGDLLRRYGLAVVLAAAALTIRGALPVPHGISIYQLPLAAVLLSAWFGGRVPGLVALLICAAGTLYWFIPPVYSFSIEADHVLGFGLFIAVGCVLSEFSSRQRRAEHALRASEERFRTLVLFSFDVYWETDAQHRFTRQEFTEQLPDAPARGSEIGKTRWEVPYLEPDEEAWRRHRATMDAHLPFRDFELARPTPDGGKRYVSVSGMPMFDDRGRFTGYRGVGRHISERKLAELERRAHVWFLESLDRISRAMQRTNDLESMMSDVLQAVLEVFGSDRAWLLYPCDPDAPSWRVVMEHTRPEFPGVAARGRDLPMSADAAEEARTARDSRGAVLAGPGHERQVTAELAERFGVRSKMLMALHPIADRPYLFGLHQCSHPRSWTRDEQRLFEEIGHRLGDALSSLIAFRSLRESERRLEAAQQIAHVGWWERDLVARRVSMSDESCRIFGVQPVDLPQWRPGHWLSLIHPEDRSAAAAARDAALSGGSRYDMEYRVVRPDGTMRVVHSQGDVTRDDSGRPLRQFGVIQDITELRQAEAELRARQDMLDLAQTAAGAVAYDWYIGARESENQWSPELEAMFGVDPGTFDGTYQGWKKLVHPDDWPAVKLAIKRAQESGDVATEYRVIHKDGSVHWLRGKGRMFFDAEGQPERNVGFIFDVTDWHQAQEELRASEARFRTFVDRATDAFFLMDEQVRVVDVNRQARDSLGWSREELIGMHPREFDVALDEASIQQLAQRSRAGEIITFETRHRRKDGTIFPVEVRSGTFEQGGKLFYLALARDISERKQAEESLRQSEAYLTEAQRLSHTGSWAFDVASNRYVYTSEESDRIFGVDPHGEKPTREVIFERIHPEDRSSWKRNLEKSLREKVDTTDQYRVVLPNGTVRHVHTIRHPVVNSEGKVVKLVGTSIDITERKRAEEELRASEARFRTFVDHATDAFFLMDEQLRVVDVNQRACESLGRNGEELIGMQPREFDVTLDEASIERLAQRARTGEIITFETRHRRKDGTTFPVEIRTGTFRQAGKLFHLALARDITERKLAEESLRQSEAYLTEAQRLSHTGSWALDVATNRYVYTSEEFDRLFGFDPQAEAPTREAVLERMHPEDRISWKRILEKSVDEKVDTTSQYRIVLPDGRVRHIHTIRHPVVDSTGKVVQLVGTSIDITERKHAEEELRASEARFRTFVDRAADAFFLHDAQLRIVDVNRQACESLGRSREELFGVHPREFDVGLDEASISRIAKRLEAGEIITFETRHRRKDGTIFPVEIRTGTFQQGGEPFYLSLARDITERKLAEETLRGKDYALQMARTELAHVSRLTTLGELTTSIVHEVSQPLGAMITSAAAGARWLAAEPPSMSEARVALDNIAADGKRAREVIARIRALTKRQAPRMGLLDLNRKIVEVVSFAEHELRSHDIVLETKLDSELPQVTGDRVQLQQVLLNLIINAIDAMSAVNDRPRELTIVSARSADGVLAEVRDSGVGLEAEQAERVFKAFYTTKSEGIGIGLSISRSIIEAHGGQLSASANQPYGAVFRFSLPIAEEGQS